MQQTKGMDITEAFETHHIRGLPQALLDKYFVRKASKPRNYILALEENGFYRTLKRRVGAQLDEMDYSPRRRTYVSKHGGPIFHFFIPYVSRFL